MTAEIAMKLPLESGKYLYFMADNVPLSKSGKLRGEMGSIGKSGGSYNYFKHRY